MTNHFVNKLARLFLFIIIFASAFWIGTSGVKADICPAGWFCYETREVTIWEFTCDPVVVGGEIDRCVGNPIPADNWLDCDGNCVTFEPVCSLNDSCDPVYGDPYDITKITACVHAGGGECSRADCCAQCALHPDECGGSSTPTPTPDGGDGDGDGGDTHLECVGSACQPVAGLGADLCTIDADCANFYTLTGTVYEGTGTPTGPGGACEGSGTAFQPDPNSNVLVPGFGSSFVQAAPAGFYQVNNIQEGFQSVIFDPVNPTLSNCTCPATCNYGGYNFDSDKVLDFYVTSQKNAWWQTMGGDIHANTPNSIQAISSQIPETCAIDPSCKPYVSLLDDLGTGFSTGIVTIGNGWVDFSNASGLQSDVIDEESHNRLAESAYTIPVREDFDYFMTRFEMGPSPTDDFSGFHDELSRPDIPATAALPDGLGSNGKQAYYSDGDLILGSNWPEVPAGQYVVVFVNGNLHIRGDASTSVAPGGFLGFVVNGNIVMRPNLGTDIRTNTVADTEGVFVADGIVWVQPHWAVNPERKFVGEGIFVGWSGFSLDRDFEDADNNTIPTELFRYRPDLLLNAPDAFKKPFVRWQEVAP